MLSEGESKKAVDYTWLQASPRGNGVGISLLAWDQPSEASTEATSGPAVVAFNILPKMWLPDAYLNSLPASPGLDTDSSGRRKAETPLWIDLQQVLDPLHEGTSEEAPKELVFAIREGDFIRVPSSWKERLLGWSTSTQENTSQSLEDHESAEEDETTVENDKRDHAKHPFGVAGRAAPARKDWISGKRCAVSSEPEHGSCQSAVRAMWNLIEAQRRVDADYAGSISDLGLLDMNLESLKHFFWRTFLNEAELRIASFRHHFSDVTDQVMAVRGRMLANELVRRQALRRVPVVCEFSDLRADAPIWVLVRGALRIVAAGSSDYTDMQQTAMTLDTRLNQVPIKFQHELVRLCNVVRVGQRENHLRRLVDLAKFVIRRRFPAAFTSAQTTSEITTILFPTSDIWESLIAEFIHNGSNGSFDTADSVALSFELFDSGHDKMPDLTVVSKQPPHETVALIDGKYKFADGHRTVTQLSMSDQYQMFAYAAISKLDTAVVNAYDQDVEHAPVSNSRHKINEKVVPGLKDGTGGDDLRPNVAVFPLPFPRPGQTAIPTTIGEEPVGTELLDWLEAAQERVRKVGELDREKEA